MDKVVFTVTPSIFCIEPITVGPPPGITVPTWSSSLITYSITSTPTPSTIPWPPITTTHKTKVSFTSTSSVMPTCQSGCGDECTRNCNDCGVGECSCMDCCKNCGRDNHDGGGSIGGGELGCIGWKCAPNSVPPPGPPPPPGGNGGGEGGGGDDNPSCTSRSAVVHTTVHCRLYSTSTKLTMETACTSTESSTTSGCMKPARMTTYTSSNCPRRAAYTPPWSDYTGALPTPGGPGWNVYTWVTGKTSTKPTAPTPTSNPNTKPLTRGPINCFKESDFPGHADLQPGDQDRFSVDFSSLRNGMGDDDTIGPGDAPITLRKTG